MQRIGITLTAILLVAFPLFSQNVNIPDVNFLKTLIEKGVDTNNDGQISYVEAEGVISLDVSWKKIRSMTGIAAFVNLDSLNCVYNYLTNLNVSNNPVLTYLECGFNQLTSLNVSNTIALKELSCYFNKLINLDVSNCVALEKLYCKKNELTSLDVSNIIVLEELHCSANQLTDLDVSNNIVLEGLDCSYNQFTDLDVSNNSALIFLQCRSNQLTSVDVSNNATLIYLSCGSNELTNLDVSNNIALVGLECIGIQLTNLDVSNNTALISLDCNSTPLTHLDISNNTLIKSLNVSTMPNLFEVCVWTTPFPPEGISVYTTGSPNLYFKDCVAPKLLNCDTVLYQSDYIEATSTEDGMIYLVPQNTEKDLSAIRIASLDSITTLANSPTKLSLSGLDNGQYRLFARDSTGNISEPESFSIMGVGLANDFTRPINIYPIPTNNLLTIELELSDYYSIEITSLNGQSIYSAKMEGPSHQLDLSSYQKGVYFITIRSKDFVATRKIIKL